MGGAGRAGERERHAPDHSRSGGGALAPSGNCGAARPRRLKSGAPRVTCAGPRDASVSPCDGTERRARQRDV